MTLENYWMVSLVDVAAIELKCKQCGATETFPPSNWKATIPVKCKNCQKPWVPIGGVSEHSLQQLPACFEKLIADEGARGCEIRLRIGGPASTGK